MFSNKRITFVIILSIILPLQLSCERTDIFTKTNSNQVRTPSFSLSSGTYNTTQNTTITSVTSGAIILYTTDGSTPTHDGSGNPTGTTLVYSTAIAVASSMTINAIAYFSEMDDSHVATASYVIQVETLSFSPSAGTYNTAQAISIASATSGASILYTIDDTVPTHDETGNPTGTTLLYSTSINGISPMTIRAIGYFSGMTDSTEASAVYTIEIP